MSELISGKEALIALANGEEVEYWCESDPSIQKRWTPIKALNEYKLSYFLEDKPRFEFRIKPRTITINGIEVPAPFEPKVDDGFWHISTENDNGYAWQHFENRSIDYQYTQFGAWDSEGEIKQVVDALRSVFK